MSKKIKLCLALFLAFAVMAQYSFSSQALVAYGLDNTDNATQTEEATEATEVTEATEATEVTEATQPADEVAPSADAAYPAVKFSETAGDVKVNINAPEGALPEGATVKVETVKAKEIKDAVDDLVDDAKIIKAVDITFYNKGKEIEPNKNVSVAFVSSDFKALKDAQVIHINDDGKAEAVKGSSVEGSKATFKSDDFSIYVIIDGDEQTFRRTYEFQDLNGNNVYDSYIFQNKAGEEVSKQVLKKGDILEPVGTPYHVGYTFQGWYVWENDSFGAKVKFNDDSVVGTLNDNETVIVRAKYSGVYYLNFHENQQNAEEDIILTTMVTLAGEAVAINDITAPLPGEGSAFYGWVLKDTNTVLPSPYTPEANADLYPVFSGAHWLRFVANGYGASYTPAICVYSNQDLSTVTQPPNPTREGYTFAGWYTEATGGSPFQWSGLLEADAVAYAHWNPKSGISYKVFYWAENADDDNYSFLTSKNMTGTAGAATNAQELTAQEKAAISGIDWNGFVVQEISQGTIEGDGSTVVNVYYDRKLVTLTFHKNSGPPTYEANPEGDYYRVTVNPSNRTYYYRTTQNIFGFWSYETINTSAYYHYNDEGPLQYSDGDSITLYERRGQGLFSSYYESTATATITRYNIVEGENTIVIQAKYGSDIHDKWPENPGGGTDWYLSQGGETFLVTLNTAPGEDTEYYYRAHSGGTTYYTKYMIQSKNGGNNFSEYKTAAVKRDSYPGIVTSADDYSPINGFHLNAASNSDASQIQGTNGGDPGAVSNSNYNRSAAIGASYSQAQGNTLYFYYLRGQYNINFISNGHPVKSESNVYYDADITGLVPTDYVVDETKATIGGVPMVFKGWFDNEDCEGYAYQFGTMPAGNLTLYAKWEPAWFIVKINPDGGALNGNNPEVSSESTWFWREYGDTFSEYLPTKDYIAKSEDSFGPGETKYYYHYVCDTSNSDDRKAYYTTDSRLSTDGKTYAKENGAYTFLGWYDEATDSPYDFASGITGPVTIKAKWRKVGSYSIRYQGFVGEIGGNVTSPTDLYADRANITISPAPKNITPKYVFDGWEIVDANGNSLDDNNGNYYQPGDDYTLDAACADMNRVIHIQAHYTPVNDSHAVSVTKVIFDANGGTLTEAPAITDVNNNTSTPSVENNKATYSDLPMNQDYDLSIISSKTTWDGHELLGWSTNANATAAEFSTDATIGIDELPDDSNTLYGVWKVSETLTVEALTDTWVYDGQKHYGAASSVKLNDQDVTENAGELGITFEYRYQITDEETGETSWSDPVATCYIINVGELKYQIRAKKGNLKSDWANGTLTVTPLAVTVKIVGNTGTETYDGTEKTVTGYKVTIIGDTATTGKLQESDLVHQVSSNIPSGHGMNVVSTPVNEDKTTFSVSGIEAGTYDMKLDQTPPSVFKNNNTNYTVRFDITDGWLKIDPAELTIHVKGGEKAVPYTGEEQTLGVDLVFDVVTTLPEGVAVEQKHKVVQKAKGTNAGTYEQTTLKAENLGVTGAAAKNYDATIIVDSIGFLKINPLAVTVKIVGNTGTETYDGTEKTVKGYSVTITGDTATAGKLQESDLVHQVSSNIPVGHGMNVVSTPVNEDKTTFSVSGTDAGTYNMKLDQTPPSVFKNNNTNYTVTFDITDGWLKIDPAELTIHVKGGEKTVPYTGEEQTLGVDLVFDVVTTLPEGVAVEQKHKVVQYAKGTNAGTYEQTTLKAENLGVTGAAAKNYDATIIVDSKGFLQIDPKEIAISIKGNQSTVTYTGQQQESKGWKVVSPAELPEGVEVSAGANLTLIKPARGTDADTYYMAGLNEKQFKLIGENAGNYKPTFTVENGWLKINPAPLTITTGSGSKTYDGTALTNTTAAIGGLVNGETATVTATGSQTTVGSSQNGYTITWGDTNKDNYKIVKENLGTLTVTAAGGGGPAGGGPAAGPAAPAAAPAAPAAPAATNTVTDNPTPTTINEPATPKAAPANWALINLLSMLATALLSLIMLIRYFGRRKDELGETTDEKRGGMARIASLIPAIGAIVAFIVTEDLSGNMALVDKWTVLMIVILAIQAGVGIVAKLRDDYEVEDVE